MTMQNIRFLCKCNVFVLPMARDEHFERNRLCFVVLKKIKRAWLRREKYDNVLNLSNKIHQPI